MPTFEVKTESLAARCDVCHQADLFDPATGVCTRCADTQKPRESVPAKAVKRWRYIGPTEIPFRIHLRNSLIGGIGTSFIPITMYFVYGIVGSPDSFFLWAAFPGLTVGPVGGFLYGRKKRRQTAPFEYSIMTDYAFETFVWPMIFLYSQLISISMVLSLTSNPSISWFNVLTLFFVMPGFCFASIFACTFLVLLPTWVITRLDRSLYEPAE